MENVFERHEKKYLVSADQAEVLKKKILQHMVPAKHDEYLIQNIYFDNENWDIIRISNEKPRYKEKMRLRCYGIPDNGSDVYLELKKKYNGIVYKRRASIPYSVLKNKTVNNIIDEIPGTQILRELNFYMKKNRVTEKINISYKRMAFTGDLRITFDSDMCFRYYERDFQNPDRGTLLLPKDRIVMEIKTRNGELQGMPLWMAHFLSENKIFPVSFSKYGKCYTDFILNQTEKLQFNREEKISA